MELQACSGGLGQDGQAGQLWGAAPGATLLGPYVQQVHWPPWPGQATLRAGVCGCLNCVDSEAWGKTTAVPTLAPFQTQERGRPRALWEFFAWWRTGLEGERSEVQRGEVTWPQSHGQ